MFQIAQGKLVTDGKVQLAVLQIQREKQFKDYRVGTWLRKFVGFYNGLEPEDHSRVKKVFFAQWFHSGQSVTAFHILDYLWFCEIRNVVSLEMKVVGSQLSTAERVESGERIIGAYGLNPSELPEGLVIPGALWNTEEKKAEAPAGDSKGSGKKLHQHPPEPWGTLSDEFL